MFVSLHREINLMKKIANIVTTYKPEQFSGIYNVVDDIENCISGIPTIVVGKEFGEKYIRNFSIKYLSISTGTGTGDLPNYYPEQDIYWTYSKKESRSDYLENMSMYECIIMNSAVENIGYRYIDFTRYGYNRIKRLIKYVLSDKEKRVFLTKDSKFMFIYESGSDYVMGISWTLCQYLNIDPNKVKRLVRRQKNNRFIFDTTFITKCMRDTINENTHLILPLSEYYT